MSALAFVAFVSRVAWAAEPLPTVAPAESTPVQSHTLLTQFPGLLGPLEFPRLPPPPAQPPAVPALAAPATPEAFGQAPAAGSGTRANYAPNMLGDAPGGGCGAVQFQGNLIALLEFPTFSCLRLSIAEDNSPMPRDRAYFQYNHFDSITQTNVLGVANFLPIDKFTFGLEKTFVNGLVSVEVRLPFARELTSDLTLQDIQGMTNLPVSDMATELGNMAVISKALLYRNDTLAFSGGLGINIPTGPDVHIRTLINDRDFPPVFLRSTLPVQAGRPINLDYRGTVTNETVNLSPFLAALWTPTDRFFSQAFLQVDFPLNSSLTSLEGTVDGIMVPRVTTPTEEQTLMRLNLGAGYWVVRRPCADWITGVAPTVEAHYTTTLENAKITSGAAPLSFNPPTFFVSNFGNLANRIDVVDLTLGGTVEIGDRATFAAGFVIPLSSGKNKPFDFELNLQLNYRFGVQTRASRSQF